MTPQPNMQNSPTIPWTTRSDLTSFDLGGFNQSSFAVKDRIQNEFYSFGELEFFILQSLQQAITLDGLKSAIQSRFGLSIEAAEIVRYVNRLAHDNLLVARQLGDGKRLFRQHRAQQAGIRKQRLMGLLSIKLPGFYPGPLLKQLKWVGWICFNPVSIMIVVAAALATIVYALFSFQTLAEKAPSFVELISPNHLALMMIGFIIAKVLHELGHGLACQNTGHECSEMGIMFLVFLPCLYCDVSDLWTEKSRAKRIFVSLAGVFVELAIATVCFWVWYFSLDGQLSRFFFGMMLVTSVNTLFVNGNPLMRYDGYYALSDLAKVPNLAAVSREYLTNKIHSFFIRQEQFLDLNRRGLFLGTYSVASFVYRWLIMVAIGWAIWTFFDNQQLESTGKIVVGLVFAIAVIPLLMSIKKFFGSAARRGLKCFNGFLFLGLIAFCIFVLANVKFHHRVAGESQIEFADAQHLFAPADGKLVPFYSDGQMTQQGDLIAKIVNEDLEPEKMALEGQLADVAMKLETLGFATESSLVAGEIEFLKKRQASYRNKLAEIQRRQTALDVRSPVDGKVVVTRRKRIDPDRADQNLANLEGGLFDERNFGCHVSRGDNLCYVGDSAKCHGYVRISEKDIELVKIGQPVRIFVGHSSRYVEGAVSKVSLESNQDVSNDVNSRGVELPTRSYMVEFEFESDDEIRVGSIHKTVVLCQPTTPFGWLNRWWRNSMWF